MSTTMTTTMTAATGPKTAEGKRIAARNATTHGLFARDVVLTHLGEDPEAYEALLDELTAQLRPKNLLQRHYVEKIAAASWRLRRLHRWQAQLFEDAAMPVREVLSHLDSVMRHETTLHRQIDTSIKMMGRELPHLFGTDARREALDDLGATEDYCARNPGTAFRVALRERELLEQPVTPPNLDLTRLDTAPPPGGPTEDGPTEDCQENCQNEPAPVIAPAPPSSGAGGAPDPPTLGGPCERGTGEQGGGSAPSPCSEGLLPEGLLPETNPAPIPFPIPRHLRYHRDEPRPILPARRMSDTADTERVQETRCRPFA